MGTMGEGGRREGQKEREWEKMYNSIKNNKVFIKRNFPNCRKVSASARMKLFVPPQLKYRQLQCVLCTR